MNGSILIRIMLASILLMLSFGVALAAEEKMTMSANESMSVNITPDNMPLSVIMIPQDNMTAMSDNKTMTMLDNKSISDNMSMPMKMPMNMPMNMSMPMNMPMSMPMKTTDVPMNIVVLQNVTVNIITIIPSNMFNA
jgi:hypothetical protein